MSSKYYFRLGNLVIPPLTAEDRKQYVYFELQHWKKALLLMIIGILAYIWTHYHPLICILFIWTLYPLHRLATKIWPKQTPHYGEH